MKITSIKKAKQEKVYDIEVDDVGHYILENGVITHNSGLEYAASTIPFLSKKKGEKDKEGDVTGAIITLVLKKARHTIENKKVETFLNYEKGLDRYWGLLDLAIKFGIFTKVSTKIELPDGTKAFQSEIEKNPEKYFTKNVLDEIEKQCKDEFCYGKAYAETTTSDDVVSTDTVQVDIEHENVSYGFEPLSPETNKKKREKK